jgi:hypothetical protein
MHESFPVHRICGLSTAGSVFLSLFLVWGLLATRPALAPPRAGAGVGAGPGARASLALWSLTASAALVVVVLQLLLPLLPYSGTAAGSALWTALGLRDLSNCNGWELLSVSTGWGPRRLPPKTSCDLVPLEE